MDAILQTRGTRFLDIIAYPDIDIPRAGATFVTGASGSGKSTLLRLFNGVVSPSAGQVLFEGRDVAGLDTIEHRKRVLLVGQSVYLFDESIAANFARFYEYRARPAPAEAEVRRYLSLCCADFAPEADCTLLSGGERQRVYLAIFLSFSPRVVMLDEPTSALDAATGAQLLENVTAHCAKAGITLVAVSHDAALTRRFAEYEVCLTCEPGSSVTRLAPAAKGVAAP